MIRVICWRRDGFKIVDDIVPARLATTYVALALRHNYSIELEA